MKSTAIKTLTALALVSGSLFSGAASADRGYVQISFGEVERGHHHAHAVTHAPAYGQYHHVERNGQPESRHHRDFNTVSFSSIDARQDRQIARITDGLRSGALTPGEAQKLLREQQEIAQMERRYLADGRLDAWEWRRLDRELDDAGQNIREEKHDRQNRW